MTKAEMTRMPEAVEVSVGPSTGRPFPGLGLTFPEPALQSRPPGPDTLVGLRLAHLRVRLELRSPSWRAALGHAAEIGLATATSLEVVLGLGRLESDGLQALADELPLAQVGIARVILEPEDGPTAAATVERASLVLTPVAPKAQLGVATRLEAAGGAIPVRSIASLPLRGWRAALERERTQIAREIGDAGSFAASPVVTSALAHRGPRPVGAAVAVSSLQMLAGAGASSVSFAAPTGWGVIRRRKNGHEVVTPAYHVLADVGDCQFGQVGLLNCSNEEALAAACIYTLEGVRLLLANVTKAPVRVVVGSLTEPAQLLALTAANLSAAVEEPERFRRRGTTTRRPRRGVLTLDLEPWSVVRIDV
jgi:hypothetical protein